MLSAVTEKGGPQGSSCDAFSWWGDGTDKKCPGHGAAPAGACAVLRHKSCRWFSCAVESTEPSECRAGAVLLGYCFSLLRVWDLEWKWMLTEGAELSPISESISEQLLSAVRSVDLYLVHVTSLYAFTSFSWLQRKPGQSKQRSSTSVIFLSEDW